MLNIAKSLKNLFNTLYSKENFIITHIISILIFGILYYYIYYYAESEAQYHREIEKGYKWSDFLFYSLGAQTSIDTDYKLSEHYLTKLLSIVQRIIDEMI